MSLTRLSWCAVLITATAPHVASAAEPAPQFRVVEQLLERMAKTYAECRTYQDSGYVKSDHVNLDSTSKYGPNYMAFNTALIRGEAFRFEFGRSGEDAVIRDQRCVIHRRGGELATQWEVSSTFSKATSLADAMATAAGVSHSTSRRTAPLLLPKELPSPRLSEMKNPKWLEDAQEDGVLCYRVEGLRGTCITTLWIDKETFLLRRVDTVSKYKDYRTEETTIYTPAMNQEAAEAALEFDPISLK